MAAKKIMAWSKCAVEAGVTGENDAVTTEFKSVGVVKDRTAVLETSDGDTLEAKSTGGETVGYEVLEGTTTLTCRVIEPDDNFFTNFGIGHVDGQDLAVDSNAINQEFSLRVTPNKIGAKGILAPKCTVSVKTGWSEEEGNYADLTFGILHGAQVDNKGASYWYKRVKSPGIVPDTENGGYKGNFA